MSVTMRSLTIIAFSVLLVCLCLETSEGRPDRHSRKVTRSGEGSRDDDGGADANEREERGDSDEDEDFQKRESPGAADTGASDERDVRSRGDSSSSEEESRSKRKVLPPSAPKPKKSKSKSKDSSSEATLCPFGAQYKSECNHCFCNPKTGVTGCTQMACFKLIIPTTPAPSSNDTAAADNADSTE